jgi:signal transduction histidine kinase
MREFLSDAAHELRTPIAGLRSVAETSLRAQLSPADQERLAVVMVQEAARAGRLVDDLLAMARIDRGLELQRHPVDLVGLLDSQVERLRVVAPAVTIHVTGTAPPVPADPERITQVLTNLLDNARRAMDGQGRIDVTVAEEVAEDGSWVVVDVRDDGPGIPADALERVFDRFVRLDQSRTGSRGGTGLGLPIARGIARAHGGDLVALPAARGAWLQLRLPGERPGPSDNASTPDEPNARQEGLAGQRSPSPLPG